ncbi:MAG: di-trans,poly-cis-decaprenylcistransferase [SAR202 cluster bacterium]|nr:di-trans,poly-cis-decaprenylcistransferase [SAR202 cluster bacterium]
MRETTRLSPRSNGVHPEGPQEGSGLKHVAIIMDGNGRWAAQRRLPRHEGHRAGTKNIRRVVETFARHGVPYLTLYAFSTENWARPKGEVRALLGILEQVIEEQVLELHRQGVRLQHLGRLDRLSASLQEAITRSLALTKDNTGITLNVAFDYGGRAEIVDAVRRIVADGVPADGVDDALVSRYLTTRSIPDPDLIIRTAGEQRLSNFLIWQSAYSEYYCTPALWPDFGPAEVEEALGAYRQRQRRFGKLLQSTLSFSG